MWKMLDDDVQCDECGGPGPPPKFLIPPPPRPPFMQELTKCAAEDASMDYDMCEAIPILDASYHSSPSLQTSAMIAVFSLLLVLVVLISSLFVWKHKRKVQNFLPCKTPTRGGHLSGGVTGGHSVTYEDPDAHLGHRPLVMRHHHNVEMLPPKSLHYPSGYPMTRTPPLFVCSSPGPDPYRSNDNVYEELGPGRDSDGESEPALHSDDDFAEDELSLPGERSFLKNAPTDTQGVATIYHERVVMPSPNTNLHHGHERNSVISSSTSSSNAGASSDHHHQQRREHTGVLAGLVRPLAASVGRRRSCNSNSGSNFNSSNKNNSNRKHGNSMSFSTTTTDDLNTSSEHTAGSDIVPSVYDDRNLVSLAFNNHHHNHHQHYANNSLANNSSNNNNNNNLSTNSNSNNNNSSNPPSSNRLQYYAKSTPGLTTGLESEVERRNRINKQLHHPPPAPVSTIFRERSNYNNSLSRPPQYPQPYYTHHSLLNSHYQGQGHSLHPNRSRTNPRSLDRRRIAVPIDHEPAYGYAEPVFHEGIIYDACLAHPNNAPAFRSHLPSYPCILPDYTSYRTLANGLPSHYHHPQTPQPPSHQELLQPQIYSRDSSFGSDSGYSHQTHASSAGVGSGDCEGASRGANAGLNHSDSGSFSNSNSMGNSASGGRTNCNPMSSVSGPKIGLSFAWNRRMAKDNSNTTTSTASTPASMGTDIDSPVATTLAATATSSDNTISSACNNANVVANNNNNNNNSTTNNLSSSCTTGTQSKTFQDS